MMPTLTVSACAAAPRPSASAANAADVSSLITILPRCVLPLALSDRRCGPGCRRGVVGGRHPTRWLDLQLVSGVIPPRDKGPHGLYFSRMAAVRQLHTTGTDPA